MWNRKNHYFYLIILHRYREHSQNTVNVLNQFLKSSYHLRKYQTDFFNISFVNKCVGNASTQWEHHFSGIQKNSRNSHSQMFFKIRVLKNFTMFTRNRLCWSLFLIKLILKRNSNTGVFF